MELLIGLSASYNVIAKTKLYISILENLNNAADVQKARICKYGPIVTLVPSYEVTNKICASLLVDWDRPVQHLMELFDLADKIDY
jgi:hypothetical protein